MGGDRTNLELQLEHMTKRLGDMCNAWRNTEGTASQGNLYVQPPNSFSFFEG